jgi:hypothetical protein
MLGPGTIASVARPGTQRLAQACPDRSKIMRAFAADAGYVRVVTFTEAWAAQPTLIRTTMVKHGSSIRHTDGALDRFARPPGRVLADPRR